MTAAADLLAELEALDVRVTVEGGRLRCNALRGILTPEHRAELAAHKQEILALLREPARAGRPQAERAADFPLSCNQERLWYLDQLNPGGAGYNMTELLRIEGSLRRDVLSRALGEVIRRHEILRTIFVVRDGEPRQVVLPPSAISIPVTNLRGRPEDEHGDELRKLAADEASRPYDLARGPLLRVSLVALGDAAHVVIVSMHHIVSDGSSWQVFKHEVIALYDAFARGAPSPLPDLPIQYGAFSEGQRQRAAAGALDRQLEARRAELVGAEELDLPADRARPAVPSWTAGACALDVAASTVRGLKRLGEVERASLFVTLLSAVSIMLSRRSRQQDFILGIPAAGRTRRELEPLIGFFVNTVALRMDLSGDPSFRELVRRTRVMFARALAQQELPFERLVAALSPERSPSRNPLVQAMFALQNPPVHRIELGELADELAIESLAAEHAQVRTDVEIHLSDGADGVRGVLLYRADLFDAATGQRMAEQLRWLLDAAADQPDQPISTLCSVPADERRQLAAWGTGARAALSPSCVHQLFEQWAAREPDRLAIARGDDRLTYGELNRRANQLAHHLRGLGVRRGAFVATCLERGLDLAIGQLAALKVGAAYVALDPRAPAARLRFQVSDSRAAVLLTARGTAPERLGVDAPIVYASDGEPRHDDPALEVGFDDPAYAIYTSGTTGQPNAAVISHRGLANLVRWHVDAFAITPEDRASQVAGVGFDASTWELWPYLAAGASVHPVDAEILADPAALRGFLTDHRITVAFAPTPLAELLMQLDWPTPSPLRLLLTGGDRLTRRPRRAAPFVVVNNYGPTECAVVATSGVVDPDPEAGPPSIGRPIANVQVHVLDEHLAPVPEGVPGELFIGGAGLALGYLERPELTAQRFVVVPGDEVGSDRLYRTGDIVRYLPGGELAFVRRADDQLKIRGFRVEPGEIERALLDHPGVLQAAVVARDGKIVAYVVRRDGTVAEEDALAAHLRARLPEYMAPAAIIALAALPLTANGKLDRRALPVPARDARTVAAPRTPLEAELAALWCEVIGRDRIGVHDRFFDLGGHSLLAARLVARVNNAYGIALQIRHFFEAPSIAELAGVVAAAVRGDLATGGAPLDLEAEATLDLDVAGSPRGAVRAGDAATVLLTGATGFLGAHLLDALLRETRATVRCLVRCSSEDEGLSRIRRNLEAYGLPAAAEARRIVPVLGDLTAPSLGLAAGTFRALAAQIDLIYHGAAEVNFAYPYELLKRANVQGTRELLRLATCAAPTPFHYVSTLSVFPEEDEAPADEDTPLGDGSALRTGYAQSKWVAERLVAEARRRGAPVCIYRLGRVTAHSSTGIWSAGDLASRLVAGCVQLGAAPEVRGVVDLIPVDHVSAAIVYLSKQPGSIGQTYHLVNPHPVSGSHVFDRLRSMGYSVEMMPHEAWLTRASRAVAAAPDHVLAPWLAILRGAGGEHGVRMRRFECARTITALQRSAIRCPPIDERLMRVYVTGMVRHGLLGAPR